MHTHTFTLHTHIAHAQHTDTHSHVHTHTHTHTRQDLRTLRFAHKQETHGRRGMYDRLQIVAFPSSYGKNTFAHGFKGDYPENGWKVYDAEAELKRLVRRWRGRCVCAVSVREEKEERVGKTT